MSKRRIWLFVVIVVAFVLTNVSIAIAPQNASAKNHVGVVDQEPRAFTEIPNSPNPNDIFEQVNATRVNLGLQPLRRNDVLTALAEQRAQDMHQYDYYSHTSSGGLVFDQILANQGYGVNYGCENLDLDFSTSPNNYVNAWLKSRSGHKQCLLNPRVTDAGYAVTTVATNSGTHIPSFVVVAIHTTTPIKN